MASASIGFFMKDEDAVKDGSADQCKRTLSLKQNLPGSRLHKILQENVRLLSE